MRGEEAQKGESPWRFALFSLNLTESQQGQWRQSLPRLLCCLFDEEDSLENSHSQFASPGTIPAADEAPDWRRRNKPHMTGKTIRFTEHALFEMRRRLIKRAQVMARIRNPGQAVPSVKGRNIFQRRIGSAGRMLLRVIVKEDKRAYHVITVYKTSKIAKYWRTQ
jgi:hypothetical protein